MSYNELRWDLRGSFHFSKISSESYRYPPLQKPKKCDKGGVSVAKAWDVFNFLQVEKAQKDGDSL